MFRGAVIPGPLLAALHDTLIAIPKSKWRADTRNYVSDTSDRAKMLHFGLVNSRVSPGLFVTESTLRYSGLFEILQAIIELYRNCDPGFKYTSIAIIDSFETCEHIDRNNALPAVVLTLGEYTGGTFWTRDPRDGKEKYLDPKGVATLVSVRWPHKTMPFKLLTKDSHRYCVVYFTRADTFTVVPDEAAILHLDALKVSPWASHSEYVDYCTKLGVEPIVKAPSTLKTQSKSWIARCEKVVGVLLDDGKTPELANDLLDAVGCFATAFPPDAAARPQPKSERPMQKSVAARFFKVASLGMQLFATRQRLSRKRLRRAGTEPSEEESNTKKQRDAATIPVFDVDADSVVSSCTDVDADSFETVDDLDDENVADREAQIAFEETQGVADENVAEREAQLAFEETAQRVADGIVADREAQLAFEETQAIGETQPPLEESFEETQLAIGETQPPLEENSQEDSQQTLPPAIPNCYAALQSQPSRSQSPSRSPPSPQLVPSRRRPRGNPAASLGETQTPFEETQPLAVEGTKLAFEEAQPPDETQSLAVEGTQSFAFEETQPLDETQSIAVEETQSIAVEETQLAVEETQTLDGEGVDLKIE